MRTMVEIRAAVEGIVDGHEGGSGDWRCLCVKHEDARLLLAALPTDAVLVTPDSLARALHMNGVGCVGRDAAPRHLTRASVVLAAIAAEVATEATDVARADAPSPLRAEGAPSEGARLG